VPAGAGVDSAAVWAMIAVSDLIAHADSVHDARPQRYVAGPFSATDVCDTIEDPERASLIPPEG
jgi:hypothetical protein